MISLPIHEASQTADVRRRALGLAKSLGFGETAAGRVGIVATELATNLIKFGQAGEILLGDGDDATGSYVEMISLDKGPGIADVGDIMRDGYSTAGSSGIGLGAVRRLCRTFDIVSWPGRGTAVLAKIGDGGVIKQDTEKPPWGIVVVPMRGEIVSGDAICALPWQDGWTIFAADGLGHGPLAAFASSEAVRLFRSHQDGALPALLKTVHEGMRHTRGAAVAVCRYHARTSVLRYAGIGNIEGRIITGADSKRLVSHDGTAGLKMRRVQEFEYPFTPESLLVMHSDGLTTTWSVSSLPGLFSAHPTLAAAVLYRHCARGRDDASVIIARGCAEATGRA